MKGPRFPEHQQSADARTKTHTMYFQNIAFR